MDLAAVLRGTAVPQVLEFSIFFLKHQLAFWILALLSYGIGRRLTFRFSYNSGWEKAAFSTGIGLGTLGYIVFGLGVLHHIERAFLIPILLIMAVAAGPVWKEATWELVTAWSRARHKPWLILAALVLLVIFLRLSVLALFPPTAPDALMYHLAEARIYARTHALGFLTNLRFPAFPQHNEMLFTLALVLYDDLTAQLVQFLMGLITAMAIYAWGRRIASPLVGVLAAALLLSNPKVLELATIAYVDIGLTMFACLAVYALYNWSTEGRRGWLVLSACLFGFAAGSKYLALAPLLFCSLFVLVRALRERRIRDAFVFGAVALLAASPWYLRSIYYTGNPVWPYFGSLFGLGTWTTTDLTAQLAEQTQYGLGKSLGSLIRLPWNLTFHARAFHDELSMPLLPLYLFLLPLTLVVGLRDKRLKLLLAFVAAYVLFWFLTVQIIRYMVLILPFVSLLTAAAIYQVMRWLPASRKPATMVGATVVFTAGILAAGWVQAYAEKHIPWDQVPVTHAQRDAYLQSQVPTYDFYQSLNRQYRNGYTVYALGGGTAYFVDGLILGDWFGPQRYARVLERLSDSQALYSELRAMGADFLEVQSSYVGGGVEDFLLRQSFLSSHFRLIYATPRILGFQLFDSPLNLSETELLRDPGFLSAGGKPSDHWTVTGRPLLTTSGADAYYGEPAMQSDLRNYMVQRVLVQPDRFYLLTHWSRWARPDSTVRLQVNWFDRKLKRLRIDIRNVRTSAEWEQHRMAITSPKNAAAADVYASVTDEDDLVWLAHVSFTQLSYDSNP